MSEEINKNFKGLYDTSKTTFITDRTEPTRFYEPEAKTPRIKNVSYSINFDKKELYKAIKDLQQKVEQLEKENKELNRMCELYGQSLYNADLTKAEKKVEQLENIRKKAIDYMKENCDIITIDKGWIIRSELTTTGLGKLFKILNKGGNNGK